MDPSTYTSAAYCEYKRLCHSAHPPKQWDDDCLLWDGGRKVRRRGWRGRGAGPGGYWSFNSFCLSFLPRRLPKTESGFGQFWDD